jgi:hypothetical protein
MPLTRSWRPVLVARLPARGRNVVGSTQEVVAAGQLQIDDRRDGQRPRVGRERAGLLEGV